jgi:replicative DNA helicase
MTQDDLNERAPANAYGTNREMPNNIEAEQALLGACLINNAAYGQVNEFLKAQHFYEPIHQQIYEIIGEIIVGGKRANTAIVKSFIKSDKPIGDMTVSQYLASLTSNAVSIINAPDYAQAIHALALRRELIDVGTEIVNTAFESGPSHDPKKQADEAGQKLYRMTQTNDGTIQTSYSGSELTNAYLNSLSRDPAKRGNRGVPIVLREIQTVLSEERFEPTNAYSLVSSSGEGKTSLTMQIIEHAASLGHPVAFFSFDQNSVQCVQQMVAQRIGLEVRRQKAGDLNDRQYEDAASEGIRIGRLPFKVFECNSMFDTMEKLIPKAVQFVKDCSRNPATEGKTPLFVFDHMSAIPPVKEVRNADEGSKALSIGNYGKALGKMTQGATLFLQQRSGSGVKRINPRPIPADLFGGEAARQAFDAVFYLYRAEEYLRRQLDTADDEKSADRINARFAKTFPEAYGLVGTAEIGSLKVRFGKVGIKRYASFVGEYTKYTGFSAGFDDLPEGGFL